MTGLGDQSRGAIIARAIARRLRSLPRYRDGCCGRMLDRMRECRKQEEEGARSRDNTPPKRALREIL